jgi:hypothetical protein
MGTVLVALLARPLQRHIGVRAERQQLLYPAEPISEAPQAAANRGDKPCTPPCANPVNGQLETPIGWICRVFRAFCDAVDLLGTSQDRANQARVGIK